MHKRVSINQICFLQCTSYLAEYKHGKLCWIAVGSFYQDIDNIMCTMKKGKKKQHCGIEKLQKLAKQQFYWPGLNYSLEQIVKECGKCQYLLSSQPM